MVTMMMGDRLIPMQQVCQNCLMASQDGQPRWEDGRLRCGRAVVAQSPQQANQFECQMGFRVIKVSPGVGWAIVKADVKAEISLS